MPPYGLSTMTDSVYKLRDPLNIHYVETMEYLLTTHLYSIQWMALLRVFKYLYTCTLIIGCIIKANNENGCALNRYTLNATMIFLKKKLKCIKLPL